MRALWRLIECADPIRPNGILVDQRRCQHADFGLDRATGVDVRQRRVERVAEMFEPPLGKRAVAVSGITAKPLGEEAFLRFTLAGEIAGEARSQQEGWCASGWARNRLVLH
jgi:hypothetical protein